MCRAPSEHHVTVPTIRYAYASRRRIAFSPLLPKRSRPTSFDTPSGLVVRRTARRRKELSGSNGRKLCQHNTNYDATCDERRRRRGCVLMTGAFSTSLCATVYSPNQLSESTTINQSLKLAARPNFYRAMHVVQSAVLLS